MTRRERLERKLEKRREWAAKREAEAVARFNAAHKATEHIPMGQPILVGHHSERHHRAALKRSDGNMRKGCEASAMATHHESKADGIEHQLDKSVFSDDADAIGLLEKRVAEREAMRDRMKAINAAHKRFLKNPASLDIADLTDAEKHLVRTYQPAYSWIPHPFAPYKFTNLGGNIRRDKERIEEVKRRSTRTQKAQQAGGVAIEGTGEWCRITFASKPDRAILTALKAAGFRWGGGCWGGRTAAIPACVRP